MKKTLLYSAVLMTGGIVLAGCADTAQTTTQARNGAMNQNAVRAEISDQKGPDLSEYRIVEEDYVQGAALVAGIATATLDDAERTDLVFMREEEKLAHDVYMALYEKWGERIFNNIAQSEQTHTDAIKTLLDRYDIADPVTDATVGAFTNPDLAKLYTDLVAQGSTSLTDVLKVGAMIEDLDIKDLQEAIERTDNADIKVVYENLQRGSRNHMRAFVGRLAMYDEVYEAQYITNAELAEIMATDQERGNGGGAGSDQMNHQAGGQGGGTGAQDGTGRGAGNGGGQGDGMGRNR